MKIVQKSGGIVINSLGEVLVVTNKGTNLVVFPKGGLEQGESYEQAATREILEESGVRATIISELGTIVRPGYTAAKQDIPSVTKHIRMYLCKTNDIKLKPIDKAIVKAEWVKVDKVANTLSWPEERDFFIKHRAQLK